MKIRIEKIIDVQEWDKLVRETYGRPYKFQQQDGCKPRGMFRFKVPDADSDVYMGDSVPEVVNDDKRGVQFAVWLARDPKQPLRAQDYDYQLELWWVRNFYPDFQTVANDLHAKGLLEAGEYAIDIDW